MDDYANIDSIMASLENIHFDVPKKGARVEDRNKLQDTLELENMVSKIDNQVFGQKAAQKYASINSSRTYSKKPALSILTSSITIQSPKASPKTSPKMSPKTSPKSSPKKTMTIDYEAEGKTLVKQNEEVDNMIAEISMLDFQLEKLNGEDSIEPNFEEMTSEEIILWYLKRYTQYRNALLGNIPQENMVKVKAVQPLKPYASFPSDQASTIMDFNADDVIILLGVIDDDWLIGFLEEDKRQIIKIFPKKFVRLEFYYLPFPQRSYTITNWENFGSSKDYIRKDDPPFFHPNLIAFKSKDNSPIKVKTQAKPKIICRALTNFNNKSFKPFVFEDVPAISFVKDQLIVITKLPNKINWCEGYALYTKTVEIGLFPFDYVAPVEIKLR